ncbi:porin [Serpentinimonas barnesii]|uniref:porin n=1 Tax=Serpentinimonas barnesii TaxID=1458427 RepID=UPI000495D62F|nr:porin [Serpentinimonas barnesii]
MKKTLIALAALAATGATLAQSSVTIYGRMDLGMSSVETTSGFGAGATTSEAFSLAGAEGVRTGSRLGFRGTEDLGGGLRAGFTYEIGINADRNALNGASPTDNARTRLANMTLSGGFGTVVVGTFMNAFDTARAFSPATANVPGGDFVFRNGAATVERFDSRTQNAVAYVSPAFSGFTFSAGTVNEEVNSGTSARKYDGMILGLGYAQGPLRAQFAFGQLDVGYHVPLTLGTPTAPINAEVQNWVLGVTYTLPQVVVSFIYEDTQQSVGPTTTREQDAWEIGARFPMGAFAPYITIGGGEITTRAGGTDTTAANFGSNNISSWQIGTTYNLSTRTFVYAAIGEDQRDLANGTNNVKRDGFAIGLVHNF